MDNEKQKQEVIDFLENTYTGGYDYNWSNRVSFGICQHYIFKSVYSDRD